MKKERDAGKVLCLLHNLDFFSESHSVKLQKAGLLAYSIVWSLPITWIVTVTLRTNNFIEFTATG